MMAELVQHPLRSIEFDETSAKHYKSSDQHNCRNVGDNAKEPGLLQDIEKIALIQIMSHFFELNLRQNLLLILSKFELSPVYVLVKIILRCTAACTAKPKLNKIIAFRSGLF